MHRAEALHDSTAQTEVVLADGDLEVLGRVGPAITSHPRLRCVAAHATMDQALKSIRLLSPNVFVFDVNLPDLTGLPSGADIALAAGNVRLVLYTELPSADLLRWAAQEFVDLVVPKSLEVPVFVDLLADPSASTPKGEFDVDFKLTPDELRVLAWLASDQSADRIARNLGVGKEAAATLISETIEKMGADDREQAIRRFSSVLAPSWGSGQQSRQRRQSPDGA